MAALGLYFEVVPRRFFFSVGFWIYEKDKGNARIAEERTGLSRKTGLS